MYNWMPDRPTEPKKVITKWCINCNKKGTHKFLRVHKEYRKWVYICQNCGAIRFEDMKP